MIKNCFSALFVLLVLVTSAGAADLNFKDVPIRDMISFVSALTNYNYIYTGESFLVSWERKDIRENEIAKEFETLLAGYSFEVTRNDNVYTILQHGKVYSKDSTIFYRLNWMDAAEVAKCFGEVWKDSVTVKSYGDVVIITGSTSKIQDLLVQIKNYDSPVSTDVNIFKLTNIPVEKFIEVVSKNKELTDLVQGDAWTNSVIVRGTKYHQFIVESYIKKLDISQERNDFVIVDVFNLDSDAVIAAAAGLIGGVAVTKINPGKLIVSGLPAEVERVANVLRAVDGDMCQIQINAVVAMLTDKEYSELGVKIGYLSGNTELTVGMIRTLYDPTVLLSVLSGGLGVDVNASHGASSQSIISEPSVMVTTGQTANIVVGQEIPVKASETLSTEGQQMETKIERKQIGVSLKVTPTVKGEFISLKVDQEISSVDASSGDVGDFVLNNEAISSSLIMSNGQTLIIGGLKVLERGTSKEDVKGLSKIPFIGGLFGNDSETNLRRNVVVSLTANIMRKRA